MHRHCLKFTVSLILLAACASSCSRHARPDPLPGFPKLVLWAWERPEDLSYIATASTGVAYLAATLTLQQGHIGFHPRMQPLRIPARTPLIAVVRIEAHDVTTQMAPEDIATQVMRALPAEPIRAVQIDFDARSSERRYYIDFMQRLRRRLPRATALEMTALVSWCQKDDWIARMPVVDAIPMFFRMGADPHSTTGPALHEPLCAASIGIATDEFDISVPAGKRVFVFNPQPWTEDAYRAVLRKVHP